MQRDGVRKERADVGHTKLVDQQLRELEDARQHVGNLALDVGAAGRCCHFRIVVANHRYAGRRRDADDLGVAKNAEEVQHHGQRFLLVAGVVVHLTATGLLSAKFNRVSQSLQHSHNGLPGGGEERVVVAGNEQRNPQTAPLP